MSDIAAAIRAGRPDLARHVPGRRLPDWLVRLFARFDPVVRERLFELGKERPVSADKAKLLLGWSPRPNDEAILATAESLASHKIA
jgi:dihydroflavonol-4-reductase